MQSMRNVKCLFVAVMVLFLAAPLLAGPGAEKAKKKKGPKAKPCPIARMLQGIELTDAQKEQVAELKKKIADRLKPVQDLQAAVRMTPDQMKARKEARDKAAADGKEGKELMDAVNAAVELTEEQEAARDKAREAMKAVGKEIRAGLMEILNADQKAALRKARGGKQGGPKPGKKGGAKAPAASPTPEPAEKAAPRKPAPRQPAARPPARKPLTDAQKAEMEKKRKEMDAKRRQVMQERFRALDVDKDGKLTPEEFSGAALAAKHAIEHEA
jgi:hypothetical protein